MFCICREYDPCFAFAIKILNIEWYIFMARIHLCLFNQIILKKSRLDARDATVSPFIHI
jgi:hypothetical protein